MAVSIDEVVMFYYENFRIVTISHRSDGFFVSPRFSISRYTCRGFGQTDGFSESSSCMGFP
jgi:hypothetical protein